MTTKKTTTLVYFLITVLFCSFCAYQSWTNSIAYEKQIIVNAKQMELGKNISKKSKKVLEYVTFSWYSGHSREIEKLQTNKQLAEHYKNSTETYTYLFIAVLAAMLILQAFFKSKGKFTALLVVINIALIIGWFAPILAIVAYQDISVIGQTVFQFESKSIVSAIQKIYQSKQYMIAGIIFAFTIVVPVLKSLLMFLLLQSRNLSFSKKTISLLKAIGKWSMLDVFVIAILMVYFSMKSGGSTDAELQIGVFYFVSYVIASMFATYFLNTLSNNHPY